MFFPSLQLEDYVTKGARKLNLQANPPRRRRNLPGSIFPPISSRAGPVPA